MDYRIPLMKEDSTHVERVDIDSFVRMLISNQTFIDNVLNQTPKQWCKLMVNPGDGYTPQSVVNVPYGCSFKDALRYLVDPSLEFYDFLYWSYNENGSAIPDDALCNVDTPIYAVYDKRTCIITFNGNEGLVRPETIGVEAGTTLKEALKDVNAYRLEYVLKGYSLTSTGTTFEDSFVIEDNMTLYAIWGESAKVAVTFVSGTDVIINPIFAETGMHWSDIKNGVINPTKEGVNFVGWSLQPGDTPRPLILDVYEINSPITLYAVYSDVNTKVLVSFKTLGADILPRNAYFGMTLKELLEEIGEPKRNGYTFVGFSLNDDSDILSLDYCLSEDITLVVRFTEVVNP